MTARLAGLDSAPLCFVVREVTLNVPLSIFSRFSISALRHP